MDITNFMIAQEDFSDADWKSGNPIVKKGSIGHYITSLRNSYEEYYQVEFGGIRYDVLPHKVKIAEKIDIENLSYEEFQKLTKPEQEIILIRLPIGKSFCIGLGISMTKVINGWVYSVGSAQTAPSLCFVPSTETK